MTFNNLTPADAQRIFDALEELKQSKDDEAKTQREANQQIAQDWWDTIKPNTPTTRQEALDAFNFIKGKLKTEKDTWRLQLLGNKLVEANEKFKEIKRNGT